MLLEVHTSDRTAFKRCRQRWDFSSNLRMNLEPRTPVTPLWFGTAMHAALGAYYHPDTPREYSVAESALMNFTSGWLASLESPSIEQVEWANGLEAQGVGMLDHYCRVWAPKHDDFTVIWVEKSFEVPILGMPGVVYSFRVDGLVEDRHARCWILEHKTAAQLYEEEEWLSLDDQCGSYVWGLTQLPSPIWVEGVIYNTLRKAVPKPLRPLASGGFSINKQQDTTFEIALATLRENYGKVPRHYWDFLDTLKAKPNHFVKRTPVRRNRNEIAYMGETLREEVLDMLNNPSIYRSPSRINCTGCPFIAPCMVKWEGGDHHWLLEQNYRQRIA